MAMEFNEVNEAIAWATVEAGCSFFAGDPITPSFGGEHVTQHTTSTHDKAGYLTADPEVIGETIDHYVAKIEAAANDLASYDRDPQAGAQTLVVSYGIISRSAKVAAGAARARGVKVSSLRLRPRSLNPASSRSRPSGRP